MKGIGVWLTRYGTWCVLLLFVSDSFGYLCEGCSFHESAALLDIKYSINYPNGSSLSADWVGEDCCKWRGVLCKKSTSQVWKLNLDSTREERLGIWYPNATLFIQFKNLKSLDLKNNMIGGWIMPEGFNQLRSLKYLDLDYNLLNHSSASLSALCKLGYVKILKLNSNNLRDDQLPSCLGTLLKLETLSLGGNNLTGYFGISTGLQRLRDLQGLFLFDNYLIDEGVSPWIGNLTSITSVDLSQNGLRDSSLLRGFCHFNHLKYLDFSSNTIEGGIHPCLGNIGSLEYLDLGGNRFDGSIPPLGNLTSLKTINLVQNQLDGVMSFSMFANLSHLKAILLDSNPQLEIETEDSTWVPKFQLKNVALSHCKLNTHGSRRFPNFLATQNQLQRMYFSQSKLTGTIPPWLFYNRTTPNRIDVCANSLVGPFPQPSQYNTSSTTFLDISDNFLHGSLPTHISMLLPQLKHLNVSRNAFQGIIPSYIGEGLNLKVLDLSNNNFSGVIPHELAANNKSLRYLGLSNNRLVGDMLPRCFNMTRLKHLLLDGNDFTGVISNQLSSSTSLMVLDIRNNFLSGPIPSWLPTALSKLTSFIFGGNEFVGHIPLELCQMQNLHMLDLSANNLSGNIPSCFNNITSWKNEISADMKVETFFFFSIAELSTKTEFNTKGRTLIFEGIPLSLMTGIDFSVNQLTGNIPPELGYLKVLHSLNLSNNALTGPFPESFQNLANIESLDLSHNKLTGPIPPQLTQLSCLSTFNVSFNNLSGRLPDFKNQFATFDETSYMSNPNLCGEPLERNCLLNNHSDAHDEEEEEDEPGLTDNLFLFYSCVAISYVLSFSGFLALLIFNKNWRQRYYTAIDNFIGSFNESISGFLSFLKNHRSMS